MCAGDRDTSLILAKCVVIQLRRGSCHFCMSKETMLYHSQRLDLEFTHLDKRQLALSVISNAVGVLGKI